MRAVLAVLVCVSTACTLNASNAVRDDSACRTLEYSDGGPRRSLYLPCAGEMMAALDELEPHVRAALNGDDQARANGRVVLRRLMGLMKAAGDRKLLDRWNDPVLTDFNIDVHNAVTHYQAFYWVRILEEPNPFAAKSRRAAANELNGAARCTVSARMAYRQMGAR